MSNIIWIGDNSEIKSSNGVIFKIIQDKIKNNFYNLCNKTSSYKNVINFRDYKLDKLEYLINNVNANKIVICEEYYNTIDIIKDIIKTKKKIEIYCILSINNRNLKKNEIKLINENVSGVIYSSEYISKEFDNSILIENKHILSIYRDYLQKYDKNSSKNKLKINNKFVLISSLNYNLEDRQDLIIKALIEIILENRAINLLLMINIKYKLYIEKKFNENDILNVNDYIYYLNQNYDDYKSDEELSEIMSCIDLGITVSSKEKKGLFILEQCKYGIPQIISDDTNLSSIIKYGCIKIKPNNYTLNNDYTESKLVSYIDIKKAINIYINKKETYLLHSEETKKNIIKINNKESIEKFNKIINKIDLKKIDVEKIDVEKIKHINIIEDNIDIVKIISEDKSEGNVILINPNEKIINNLNKIKDNKYIILKNKEEFLKYKNDDNERTKWLNNIVLNESNKLENEEYFKLEYEDNKILSIKIDDILNDSVKILYIPKKENLFKIIVGCENLLKNNKINKIFFEIDDNKNSDYTQITFNLCLNNFIIYDNENDKNLYFEDIKDELYKFKNLLFIYKEFIPILYFNNNKKIEVKSEFKDRIFIMNNYILDINKVKELKIITNEFKNKILNNEISKNNLELLLTIYLTIQNINKTLIISIKLGENFKDEYELKIKKYIEFLNLDFDILVIDYDNYEEENKINNDIIKVKRILNLRTFLINIKNKKKIINTLIPFDDNLENEINKSNLNVYVIKNKLIN